MSGIGGGRMKIEMLPGSDAPGMFSVKAQNVEEVMLLDIFTRWPQIAGRKQRLFLSSFGGNREEGVYGFQFCWREESSFAPSVDSSSELGARGMGLDTEATEPTP